MNTLWTWIKNKFGRLMTGIGSFLMTVQLLDIGFIRQPLTDFVGDQKATRIISGVALVCFILSYIRHQIIANKVSTPVVLPPPQPGTISSSDTVIKLLLLAMSVCLFVSSVPAKADEPSLKFVQQPMTSVVVTQCNLIVAIYLTMKDGKLLRFDKSNSVPYNELMRIASSAIHSERVEVSCNSIGAVGYEKHDPV